CAERHVKRAATGTSSAERGERERTCSPGEPRSRVFRRACGCLLARSARRARAPLPAPTASSARPRRRGYPWALHSPARPIVRFRSDQLCATLEEGGLSSNAPLMGGILRRGGPPPPRAAPPRASPHGAGGGGRGDQRHSSPPGP